MKIILKILIVLFNLGLWRLTWGGSKFNLRIIVYYVIIELILIWILL